MKEIGLKSYRFSISWSRVLPEGTGRVNKKGLEFYRSLCDELTAAGIGSMAVEVYAPGDEVEWLINGKSRGRKPAGAASGCRTLFETVYEPDTVKAVAYSDGKEIGAFELRTAGEALNLRLEKDYDGKELHYLALALTDGNGNMATDRDELLTAEVTGAGLLGFGSGNPKPLHNYNEGKTETWNGRAQMLLRKTGRDVRVTVTSASGKTAHIEIPARR